MGDLEIIQEININIIEELAAVGDRRTVKGSMTIEITNGYDMVFHPGDKISWSLDILRISGGIEVKGVVSGRIDLECYRCLEKYAYPCEIEIEEHVVWFGDEREDLEQAEEGEYHVEKGIFDLLQIMRDVIGLSFPTKRVCGDDCKGLCSVCGQNLNIDTCGCSRKTVDSRLKPLELMKEKLQRENGLDEDLPKD